MCPSNTIWNISQYLLSPYLTSEEVSIKIQQVENNIKSQMEGDNEISRTPTNFQLLELLSFARYKIIVLILFGGGGSFA